MVRSSKLVPAALLASACLLAACGSSTGDRGLSGAGIGAAAGTALGMVTGLGIVEGALIGAGAGGDRCAHRRGHHQPGQALVGVKPWQ